jgi:hypothetical protein
MKKKNQQGMFLTLKQLDQLGVISLENDHILVKKRKRRRNKKKGKTPGVDFNQMKSQNYMLGGGVSHQLRSPTISSEQGILSLRLLERKMDDENDISKRLLEYQKKNDLVIKTASSAIRNRFNLLENMDNTRSKRKRVSEDFDEDQKPSENKEEPFFPKADVNFETLPETPPEKPTEPQPDRPIFQMPLRSSLRGRIVDPPSVKKKRGRPPGSKNKSKSQPKQKKKEEDIEGEVEFFVDHAEDEFYGTNPIHHTEF